MSIVSFATPAPWEKTGLRTARLPRTNLLPNGASLSASCGTSGASAKVHIFPQRPDWREDAAGITTFHIDWLEAPQAIRQKKYTRHGIPQYVMSDFEETPLPGEEWLGRNLYFAANTLSAVPYYEGGAWHFFITRLSHYAFLGTNSRGRTDITAAIGGSPDPFPSNESLPPGLTDASRRAEARTDLTPSLYVGRFNGENVKQPSRNYYWSKAIATEHELNHISDNVDAYEDIITTAKTELHTPLTATAEDPNAKRVKRYGEIQNKYEGGIRSAQQNLVQGEAPFYYIDQPKYQALVEAIVP